MKQRTVPRFLLKDIANYIGVHYTKVSKVIKRIEGEGDISRTELIPIGVKEGLEG